MSDVVVYYYLVKQFDTAHRTGEYEKAYNDITTYLYDLPENLQIFLIKYIRKNIKPFSRNKWLRELRKFSKSYKLSMVNR